MNPPGNNTFITWIRSFAIGSDLTGVSAPVSFYSGPYLFRYVVLTDVPVSLYTDLTDAPVPISLIPVTSSRATNLSFDLINRISSSHYCLWVLINRINAFVVLSSKYLDSLCRAVVTDKMQPLARES
jgi:hypothetical protein